MSRIPIFFLFFSGFILLILTAALAQHPVIDSNQLETFLAGKKNVALIDSWTYEEYLQAHIPGAVSIPADHVQANITKYPKDKTTPIIYYCRGLGCNLSRMSAAQAVEMGYTYLMIYQAGMLIGCCRGALCKRAIGRAGSRSNYAFGRGAGS